MLDLLNQLFQRVHTYMREERFDRHAAYRAYAGHTTMAFDYEAENIIIHGLEESGMAFEVITEERDTFHTAPNPAHRIIIDPVDGSNNVIRAISTAGLALAVLPIDAPVLPEHVQYALVGDLYSGTVYTARKSHGARRNGQRCEVSQVHHIQHCLAGLNLDGRNQAVIRTLLTEQPVLSHVRRCGSSAMDSVYVASGSYDAYIDVGDTLTGESFLASGCIVLEAGGIISDHQGKPLRPITSLRDGYSIVIASTHELHQEIIDRITRCL